MSTDIDIRFWYNTTPQTPNKRFWDILNIVEAAPQTTPEWNWLRIRDRCFSNVIVQKTNDFSLAEVETVLEKHTADTLNFSINVPLSCWWFTNNVVESGFCKLRVGSWGKTYTTTKHVRFWTIEFEKGNLEEWAFTQKDINNQPTLQN